MKYKFAKKCLVIILLLLMVVGCGRGETPEEAPVNGEAATEATPAAEEAPPEEGTGDEAQAEQPTEEANGEAPPEEGEAPTEEAQPEEAQPEEGQPEEAQPEEAQPEEAQPEQPAPAPAANLTGQWDLNLNVNQWLFSDGRTEDTNTTARILASLTQNGTQLSGNFLEVSIDGFDDACTQASITGTILEDNQVKWTMNYSGDCCPGQQITFVGNYDAQAATLSGSFSPLGTPPNECRPWFADVTGSRR